MIQDYYGLTTNAFSLSPDLDFVFVSKAHEETLAHLAYGLEQNEEITLIMGDIGTGKTLALHRLLSQVSKSFVPVYITVTHMDFEQLMRLIMMKLDLSIAADDGLAVLLHSFEKCLVEYREKGQRILLVIDEAQNLPIDTLESIRMIMNLAHTGKPALQLVLVGQLNLGENLDLKKMRQLRQRIRVEYKLSMLSRKEMEAYILHRLEVGGRTEQLFNKSALDKIYKYSEGVPRLVNHLVTSALVNGFVAESKVISGKHIEKLQDVSSGEIGTADLVLTEIGSGDGDAPQALTSEAIENLQRPKSSRGLLALGSFVILAVIGFATQDLWRPYLPGENEISHKESQLTDEQGSGKPANTPRSINSSSGKIPTTLAVVETPSESGYVGHVASFRTEKHAQQWRANVAGSSVTAFVKKVDLGAGDLWFRVYLGPFKTEQLAQDACKAQRDQGVIQYFSIMEEADLDSL
jgi:general secretion pathway protein A